MAKDKELSNSEVIALVDGMSANERLVTTFLAAYLKNQYPSDLHSRLEKLAALLRNESWIRLFPTPDKLMQWMRKTSAIYRLMAEASMYRIQMAPRYAWIILRHYLYGRPEWVHYEEVIKTTDRSYFYDSYGSGTLMECQRALLNKNEEKFIEIFNQLSNLDTSALGIPDMYEHILGSPPDLDFLRAQSDNLQWSLINGMLTQSLFNLGDYHVAEQELKRLLSSSVADRARALYCFLLCTTGRVAEAKAHLAQGLELTGIQELYTGWIQFLRGEHEQALESYTLAAKKLNRRGFITSYEGFAHALVLLLTRDYKRVQTYASRKGVMTGLFGLLNAVVLFMENQAAQAMQVIGTSSPPGRIGFVFQMIVSTWIENKPDESKVRLMQSMLQQATNNNYPFFELELCLLLAAHLPAERASYETRAAAIQQTSDLVPLLPRLTHTAPWERALQALERLQTSKTPEADARIVWLVDFEQMTIQPKEQKRTKSGNWSTGRNIALKRLKEEDLFFLTDQDRRIIDGLRPVAGWYHESYEWNLEIVLPAMVGCTQLYLLKNPELPVELLQIEPELIVEEKDGQYLVGFEPPVPGLGAHLIKETTTRYKLLQVSAAQWDIAQMLGSTRLTVPRAAKDRLLRAVSHVAAVVNVQSSLADTDMPLVEAETTPHVLLVPVGDGFKVEVFAKPFGTEPPYAKPGTGREHLIAEVGGKRVQARRKLAEELTRARKLEENTPILSQYASYQWEWQLDDKASCLQLLLELDPQVQAGEAVIEWPKGERLRLTGQVGFGNLSLKVRGSQDWFAIDGELRVDEQAVLNLQQLFRLLENDTQGGFIELSEGRFLALTQSLRRQLQELASTADRDRKGELRLHGLASGMIEEFEEMGASLKADAQWRKHLKRIAEAREIRPVVPPDLQADLRPYQEEGFTWMSRLAHWGVGACLADDMGLGKTVQALALLLDRARLGPALVVAPASVVRNWLREAERFTPGLRPLLLSEGNRQEIIAELGPYDLLLVSYTLFQIESERLTSVQFATVVLDEAQAIKNRQTKRSQAAKQIQAGFRLITTGTPIENHLGEIWNLFDFLNPGLLGSLDRFNERYAIPIERYEDRDKRHSLRRILRPFILRRRKSEVLSELPEKTEITLHVELSARERAFYEALRREAIDKLSQLAPDVNPGEQRLRILAEITRLRQACCNPALVMPETDIPSSKLQLFADTVLELRENGHKALVFSQFVRHLKLIEAWVQAQGIAYQYLDGQTPLKQREARVKAFQHGEGDLFLISLKAGGVGLNLTAADFVIHLDPWWNPAVEDQASDRAHRIGQQRPVTVYRMVAEQTIEEKIVHLHSEKRELADSLLEGTEGSAHISSDELLSLIREM
ncbi:MAG: DEAD/DEAH box helicase [Bacteroidia bacterium]